MSFPSSPINNQQATVNNITYFYSTATSAWTRVLSQNNIGVGGTTSTFVITNTATSTSPTTGALQVAGGAGIVKNLTVGGSITATNIYVGSSQILPTNVQNFTATSGQTTFTVSGGYTVGAVQVFANGILLEPGDYTATNGTTVILSVARSVSDQIIVISNRNSSLTTAPSSNSLAIAMSVALGF
jgi:hypothetical protein